MERLSGSGDAVKSADGGASEGQSVPASPCRERALNVSGSYMLLGLMIALSSTLANGSLAYVSQPVKARRRGAHARGTHLAC